MSQGNLTSVGFLWILLSGLSATLACAGYYLPYWVQGTVYNTTVHIGVFSRCNYLVKGADGLTRIEAACGKYATFHDIPSEAWRACTVMIGVGCGLLLLVALTAVFCCCMKDIATQSSARVAGGLQFLSAFLLAISCGIYPSGWGSVEFKQVCGEEANFYKLGDCRLGWASFVFLAGTASAFICAALSSKAAKRGSMLYTRTNVEISNSFIV